MDEHDELIQEARAGVLQCQAQIDRFETSVYGHIDRLCDITSRLSDDRTKFQELQGDEVELLLLAGHIVRLRHLQSKFKDRLLELGADN